MIWELKNDPRVKRLAQRYVEGSYSEKDIPRWIFGNFGFHQDSVEGKLYLQAVLDAADLLTK